MCCEAQKPKSGTCEITLYINEIMRKLLAYLKYFDDFCI